MKKNNTKNQENRKPTRQKESLIRKNERKLNNNTKTKIKNRLKKRNPKYKNTRKI